MCTPAVRFDTSEHVLIKTPVILVVMFLGAACVHGPSSSTAVQRPPPRLVLQITIDGLRGDLPNRFAGAFGEGGFRYLLEQGIHYTNAHYQHANTETIVGHTSLATGAVPAIHGMIGNVWFDREQDRLVYNIEDPRYRLLTPGATKELGLGEALIEAFFQPYVYLDRDLIRDHGLDQAEVEQAIAKRLSEFDGVAIAVSSTALSMAKIPDTPLTRSILHNLHAKRSGDVYVVFEPNVFINDFDGLVVASTHGSPWRYDTFVPVVFAGAALRAGTVSRPITPYDIAPTLATYLGVKSPSGSASVPLPEVLGE